MNAIKLLAAAVATFCLFGCATQSQLTQTAKSLTTPTQVQSDITALAKIAKPYLTAQEVANITELKQAAQSLANGTMPIQQFQALLASVAPAKDAPALATALAALSIVFDGAYQYYGLGNTVFTQYCTAVSTGLTAAGY